MIITFDIDGCGPHLWQKPQKSRLISPTKFSQFAMIELKGTEVR
jgi:hypothetical protein